MHKLTWLRWLCVLPLLFALPFLFFGVIWMSVVHALVAVLLGAAASGIWIVFAEDD